ncbi:uncharacterized protein LOC110720960 [Chenopodium quinoa]|uniref:KIB1-4 beta-propeller domain-containing protein n=1 Tax=Chenopodium quinoa TaxID=63459 RepID=A0A803LY95_CHEQI|nr:uncharacterized protein LOC110720960 [Chenopodium quinoa]
MKSIPELCHKDAIAFFHGWLILRNQEDWCIYSLFNITTLRTITLPRLPTDDVPGRLSECFLTSSPYPATVDADDDNCMFLLVFNSAGLLFFCRPWADTCSWVVQSVELEDGTKVRISNLVTLNGVIHGSSYVKDPVSRDIFYIVDELNTLTIRPLQIGMPNTDSETLFDFFIECLLESCGRIYCAKILERSINNYRELNNIVAIKAWELNLMEKNWMELKSLNGRAFILNRDGSTWCWGNNTKVGGIQENCLCFTFSSERNNERNFIVSTNLVDQTWTVVSPSPNLVSPDEYDDSPVWVVMPRLQAKNIPNQQRTQIDEHEDDNNINEAAEEEDSSCCWFDKLPLDIIRSLPKYMHLFEYWKFRASCKMFHTALPEPRWRTNNEFPLFLFFKNEVGLCKLMDPCRSDIICSNTLVPFSQDRFTLIFSKNGWLICLVAQYHLKFYNLFTGVTGVFPPLFDECVVCAIRSIAFSSDPTSSDCLTVALLKYPEFLRLCYLQSGDETWEEFDFDMDDQDVEFRPTECAPTYLGGAFYFPDCSGNLGVFEIVNDDEPCWQVYGMPDNVDDDFESCHLVDCEGELYIVFVYRIEKCRVQVFRFNGTNKSWVVIDDIGNHIFFISKTSCYSIVPSDPTMRNRIYLPKIVGNNIVFYSLNTKMYHILGSGDSKENLYGTNQPLMCCWI